MLPLLRRAALAASLLLTATTTAADGSSCAHKPGQRLTVRLAPEAALTAPGEPVRIGLEVELIGAAGALRVVSEGTGALAPAAVEVLLPGPWAAGSRANHTLAATAVGRGEGRLRITVEALDDFGAKIQARTALLFARVDDDGAWTSGSSDVDLEWRRVQHLRAIGRLSAEAAAAQRRELSRGRAVTDFGEPTPRRTVTGDRIDAALEAWGTKVAQPETSAATGAASISGTILWRDRDGRLQSVSGAPLEVIVDGVVSGTLFTNGSGFYAGTINMSQDSVTVSIRVYARSAVADVRPHAEGSTTYFVESEEQQVARGGESFFGMAIGNDTVAGNAFSVHAALVLIGSYMTPLTGSLPSRVDVLFPTTNSNSSFNVPNRELKVLLLDRHDWDVIHHEYGHYVQDIHGFVDGPGGRHTFDGHLSTQAGFDKDKGIRMAWSEGWPTFFGIVGQARMGAAALGIPDVGDLVYSDREDTEPSPIVYDIEAETGSGEDVELSVTATLLDLVDGLVDGLDEFQRPDTTLFDLFVADKPVSLADAWNSLGSVLSNRDRAQAGAVFAHNQVAPKLLEPADGAKPEGIPTFRWKKHGGGMPNPNDDFKLVVWDRDFDDKEFELELGDTDEFTPGPEQWAEIIGDGQIVHWVIEGRNTTAPVTAGGSLERYWSQAHRLGAPAIAFVIDDTDSMTEEIDSVRAALSMFIDELAASLPPEQEPPVIMVLTFKDSLTERLVSNDLALVQSVVDSLSASGGGPCPEVGAEAIDHAVHFLGGAGTILFASDASSSSSTRVPAMLNKAGEKGIEVHVILSGDCEAFLVTEDSAPPRWPTGMVPSGPQPYSSPRQAPPASRGGDLEKPGDDEPEPPHVPIDDEGQEPIDDHGDTPETATLLVEGASPTLGHSDNEPDWFALDFEAGERYLVRFETLGAFSLNLRLFDQDGETLLVQAGPFMDEYLVWRAATSGRYYLRAQSSNSEYQVSFERDPLGHLTSGVGLYSLIATETGGFFSLQEGVNDDAGAEYTATMFNIMLGSIRPTVVGVLPRELPRATTLAVTLTGSRTNWNASTAVDVLTSGVTVQSVAVLGPKRLVALLEVAADAPLGPLDLVVTTTTDGGLEEATGVSVAQVTEPVPFTMLLSVQPAAARRGETLDVSFYGSKTFWSEAATLDLGPGIEVLSTTFLSGQRIDATIAVAPDAQPGFRNVIVVGGFGNDDELERGFLVVNETVLEDTGFQGIAPSAAPRGSRLVVSVQAEGTSFVDGVTTADFGPGLVVVAVQVLSPTRAEVELEIPVNAPLGFRDVTLTTNDEVFLAEAEFFVEDFASVRTLDGGLAKLSESLAPSGAIAFEFDGTSGQTLARVFVAPFGDGTNGTVAAPDVEVTLVTPSSAILASERSASAPVDFTALALTETGSYRLVVVDRGGGGGSYKGIALLEEDSP